MMQCEHLGVSWLADYPCFGCRGSLNPEGLLSEARCCVGEAALHPGPHHLHRERNHLGLWGVLVLGRSGEERSVRRVILHGKVVDPAGFRSFRATVAPHAANT